MLQKQDLLQAEYFCSMDSPSSLCFDVYSEEEEILDYHSIRGNRDGGYHHGSGGRGQTEAADFWEDFNVHDPQSIYADKFTAQEEYGNNAGNYHQNAYNSPTPSVESSWGQRQVA